MPQKEFEKVLEGSINLKVNEDEFPLLLEESLRRFEKIEERLRDFPDYLFS